MEHSSSLIAILYKFVGYGQYNNHPTYTRQTDKQ
jgi:hypothetical protein